MKLWLENQDSFPLQLSVQECALKLAMPRARAGKVINELIDKGHVEPDYSFGRRGRPKRFIEIPAATTEMLRNLKPMQSSDVLHVKSIHRLLAHRSSDTGADSPSLSPANVVFLIALLSCANECGAVHGLGTAKLTIYTGMTAQRINLQISKLKKLGLILATASGVTGRQVLGRKTTSYWLDLKRNLFRLPNPSTIIRKSHVPLDSGDAAYALFDIQRESRIVRTEYAKKSGKQLSVQEAVKLATVKLHVGQVTDVPNFDFSLVQGFLKEGTNLELRIAFQTAVDRIARVIAFSRMAETLGEHRQSPTIGQLKALYRELLPARFQSFRSTDFPLKENRQMLLRVVLKIATSLASDVLANLPRSGGKFSPVVSFELVPTPRGSNFRDLIAVVYPPESHSSESKRSNIETNELTSEAGSES
jgi:hypothetical protein